MAWRIDQYVVRGEIDNRTRGRVTGRIWFVGRPDPVQLALEGNAWRDLAGRKLEFVNPAPAPGLAPGFARQQPGQVGDITASRKVRVPEIPREQIGEYYAAGKSWPEHWGNSLYLEWFSLTNGRVVIESASYQLTISPDSTWEMTMAEESAQREANAATLGDFMQRLGDAAAPSPADDHSRILTEEEAEQLQARSDRLVDRVMARMDREGDPAKFATIVDEEIERARRERGEPELTPEQEAERREWVEEMNAAAAEAMEEFESEKWKHGNETPGAKFDIPHPLSAKVFALSVRVMRDPLDFGWLTPDAMPEHPLIELALGVSKAGAKLASALDGEWPPPLEFCAMSIVRLKQAAAYLDDALFAAETCQEEALGDMAWVEEVTMEAHQIRVATSKLIAELRARLKARPG